MQLVCFAKQLIDSHLQGQYIAGPHLPDVSMSTHTQPMTSVHPARNCTCSFAWSLTLLYLPASWLHPTNVKKASVPVTAARLLVHCAGAKLPRVAEPNGEAYAQAVTTLLPYLLSHRSRLAAFTASQAVPNNTASSTATTAGQAASTATATSHLTTASSASTTGRAEPATAWATSDFGQASGGAPSTSCSGGKGQEEEVPGSPVRSRPQEFLASLQPEQRHRLAVLVDTAILKVLPLAGSTAVE